MKAAEGARLNPPLSVSGRQVHPSSLDTAAVSLFRRGRNNGENNKESRVRAVFLSVVISLLPLLISCLPADRVELFERPGGISAEIDKLKGQIGDRRDDAEGVTVSSQASCCPHAWAGLVLVRQDDPASKSS